MAGTVAQPIGITDPPIDDLLEVADSKYGLVIEAAKRARQINAYYSQLEEGLLQNIGPLVEVRVQEKPLSIAMREINHHLLEVKEVDPAELAAQAAAESAASAAAQAESARLAFSQIGNDVFSSSQATDEDFDALGISVADFGIDSASFSDVPEVDAQDEPKA